MIVSQTSHRRGLTDPQLVVRANEVEMAQSRPAPPIGWSFAPMGVAAGPKAMARMLTDLMGQHRDTASAALEVLLHASKALRESAHREEHEALRAFFQANHQASAGQRSAQLANMSSTVLSSVATIILSFVTFGGATAGCIAMGIHLAAGAAGYAVDGTQGMALGLSGATAATGLANWTHVAWSLEQFSRVLGQDSAFHATSEALGRTVPAALQVRSAEMTARRDAAALTRDHWQEVSRSSAERHAELQALLAEAKATYRRSLQYLPYRTRVD